MAEKLEQDNDPVDYFSGNTRIRTCEDYCRERAPEEIDAILKAIGKRTYESLARRPVRKIKTY